MRRHLFAVAAVGLAALLIAMLTMAALGAPSSHRSAQARPVALTGEVTPEARRLLAVVVRAAQDQGVEIAADELEIRFVDRVEPEGFLGGRTDGRLILVGRNVALPERTILHELAHAVVGLEFGHGEPWRSVYITAFRDEFGARKAERELRRLRWVYDKSYLDTGPRTRATAGNPSPRLSLADRWGCRLPGRALAGRAERFAIDREG
jgi:hypothetical protein